MSMPQQGPPDPYTPGPVSGGPQSPYDPQSAPPSPQQQPPGSFGAPGPAPAARPAMLMLGGIGTGVLGLLFLLRVVTTFLDVENDYSVGPMGVNFVYAAYFLAMALAAAAAAVLAMTGNDFGRIFAAAVAGAAMWDAAGWWKSLIGPLVSGHGLEVDHYPWFPMIVSILGGFAGIAVVAAMATPAISTYAAEKRRKPAGSPPMGPMPSGPGMPPPPGQQPGQAYGGQQQPGQTYGAPPPAGQEQSGQTYGGQPPTGEQPGQTYGQPQPGSPYGEQPPGAPPPGQQY